jgi:hypothetical protein
LAHYRDVWNESLVASCLQQQHLPRGVLWQPIGQHWPGWAPSNYTKKKIRCFTLRWK